MKQNVETTTMYDIVAMVKKKTDLKKEDIMKCFYGIFGAISACVDNGKPVTIPDFGVFEKREVKEHSKVLPTTKDFPDRRVVVVPNHEVVRFRPYKNFTSYYLKNEL